MELLAQLAVVLAPVFLIVGLGYGWSRAGQPFDADLMGALIYNVGAPALIIATFAKVKIPPATLAEIAGIGILAYLSFAAIGAAVLRLARLSLPAYLPALTFPFVGGVGLPVCLLAFGEQGLAYALVFVAISAMGSFTIGASMAAGKISLGGIARTPAIYAVAFTVAMLHWGWTLPDWAINTTGLLGGIVIPMQLIAVGVGITRLQAARLPRTTALSLVRLGMGAMVGFGLAELFALGDVARAVVIIQCAMAVAPSSYVFAQIYKREPEEIASMVLISTLISFATLPILLAVLL